MEEIKNKRVQLTDEQAEMIDGGVTVDPVYNTVTNVETDEVYNMSDYQAVWTFLKKKCKGKSESEKIDALLAAGLIW